MNFCAHAGAKHTYTRLQYSSIEFLCIYLSHDSTKSLAWVRPLPGPMPFSKYWAIVFFPACCCWLVYLQDFLYSFMRVEVTKCILLVITHVHAQGVEQSVSSVVCMSSISTKITRSWHLGIWIIPKHNEHWVEISEKLAHDDTHWYAQKSLGIFSSACKHIIHIFHTMLYTTYVGLTQVRPNYWSRPYISICCTGIYPCS